MKILSAVKMAHFLLKGRLATADAVIDATAGNGQDTLFLALHTPDNTIIRAFDIQQDALDKTQKVLEAHSLANKVKLVLDSHANMAKYCMEPADIIMFNLGYLPGGTHTVTTITETTAEAVKAGLDLLKAGGIMTVAAYPGHPEGKRELASLQQILQNISQRSYTVACWHMVNQVNSPPVLYVIEKLRGDLHERTPACQDKGNY